MNNPISTAPFLQGNASLAQGEGTGNPFQIDNSTLVQLQGVAKDYVDKKQAVYDEYKNNFLEGMATFNQSANYNGEEAKMLREKEAGLIDFYKANPEMLSAPEKYPELLAQRNAMLGSYSRDVAKVKNLYAIDASLKKSMENNAVDRGQLEKDYANWKTLPFEERLANPPLPLTNIDASITSDDWAKATKFAISDSEVFTKTLTNDKGQIVTQMWKKVDNDKINSTIGKEFDYTLQKKYETAKKENPNLDFNAFRADFFNQRNPIKMTTLDGKDGLWVLDETKIDVNEDQKNKYEMQKQNDAQAHDSEEARKDRALQKYIHDHPTTRPTTTDGADASGVTIFDQIEGAIIGLGQYDKNGNIIPLTDGKGTTLPMSTLTQAQQIALGFNKDPQETDEKFKERIKKSKITFDVVNGRPINIKNHNGQLIDYFSANKRNAEGVKAKNAVPIKEPNGSLGKADKNVDVNLEKARSKYNY